MTNQLSKPETEQTISPDYAEILRLVRKYRRYQDKTLADIFVRVGRELENSRPKSDRCPKCFRTNIEHERLLNPTCQSPWHDAEQLTRDMNLDELAQAYVELRQFISAQQPTKPETVLRLTLYFTAIIAVLALVFYVLVAANRSQKPTEDQLFGCTIKQQTPSGECQ